jgi:2-polyprenyl-3-methyl-5-hydroxy-6-metoxy-1,4-benzoquinol methylase
MFEPMCEALQPDDVTEYLREVSDIWNVCSRVADRSREMLELELLEGLDFHTVSFLRRQAQFAMSAQYAASDPDQVFRDLYLHEDAMKRYLDGLLLTYVAWPNHYRLLRFYKERYLPSGECGTALEIGPGHGWLALQQVRANARANFKAIDISPSSAAYCGRLLEAAGCDMTKCDIVCGDILKWDRRWRGLARRVTIAEIIEHVIAPVEVLERALALATSDAIFFVSTCVNIEAVDHLHRFETLDEVRATLYRGGLSLVEELILPLETHAVTRSFEYAAICRAR